VKDLIKKLVTLSSGALNLKKSQTPKIYIIGKRNTKTMKMKVLIIQSLLLSIRMKSRYAWIDISKGLIKLKKQK